MKSFLLFLVLVYAVRLSAQNMPSEYVKFYEDLGMVPYEEKFKRLDDAMNYYPEDPWFLWMRASVYDLKGEDEKALEDYHSALALDSNFAGGHASLARFLRYNHSDDTVKMNKALLHINTAIRLEPEDDYYKIDRGYIYLALKEFGKAEEQADFTLSLDDFDIMAAEQLKIETLYQVGKKEELKAFVLEHDLSNEGEFLGTNFCLMLASVYEEMGLLDNACKLYNGASQPYIYMDEEIPAHISDKLKKCN